MHSNKTLFLTYFTNHLVFQAVDGNIAQPKELFAVVLTPMALQPFISKRSFICVTILVYRCTVNWQLINNIILIQCFANNLFAM